MTTIAELGGWPAILRQLVAGQDLPGDHAAAALADVLAGEATPAQIAAFAVGLRAKGETVEELAAMVGAMLAAAERVTLPAGVPVIDTCGTGGNDTRRTAAFSVSTLAGLVATGAGAVVCKHGNRAASSTCGSADVLEGLGVVASLGPAGVERCLAEVGMAFCFAPRYHPAMRHAGPVRRELGVPTFFNVLGPMSNPSGLTRQVLGVSDGSLAPRLAEVLQARGAERAMVVTGGDGLDELSISTTSMVHEVRDGVVRAYELDPSSVGLTIAPAGAPGGDASANVALAGQVLAGKPGPHRDIVLLNSAAALVVAGVVDSIADGLDAAAASIDDGRAASVLERLVSVSNAAAEAEAE